MKKLFTIIGITLVMLSVGCGRSEHRATPITKSASTQATQDIADQLNLTAVNELAQDSRVANAEDFERLLNDLEVGVNNLDLNDDGDVDYISVSEDYVDNFTLFNLYVDDGESEYDIAQVRIQKQGNQAVVEVHGSSTYYPESTRIVAAPPSPWAAFALGLYLGNPYRPSYSSPYYYGYYPALYQPRVAVAPSIYRSRSIVHRTQTTTRKYTHTSTSRINSPTSQRVVKKNTMSKKPEKKSPAVLEQRKTNKVFANTDRSQGAPKVGSAFGGNQDRNPNTKAQPPPSTSVTDTSASNQTRTNQAFKTTDRTQGKPEVGSAFGGTDPKPQTKPASTDPKPQTKPASTDPKPQTKPDPKPQTKPASKPKPKPKAKPAPKPKPQKKNSTRRNGKN